MNTLDKVRKAPSCKTMGIEIEGALPYDVYNSLPDYCGFFYKGYDGSITGLRGRNVEFVSQPLTYPWMQKEIDKLFKKIGPHFSYNDSCGIHVHVSKKWLSDKKAKEVYAVLKDLTQAELLFLFGRGSSRWTDENIGERYCTVNITNKHTNEFRVFKSGGRSWALYCVAISKFMVEHAHHLTSSMLFAFRDDYFLTHEMEAG